MSYAGLKYAPTSIIFMKIPSISKFQWHSFSIASSSSVDDKTMTVIIKCDGSWTNSLYDIIQGMPVNGPDQRVQRCIPVSVEGPYGPASSDFIRYVRKSLVEVTIFTHSLKNGSILVL